MFPLENSSKHLNKNSISSTWSLSDNIREGMVSNSFYEASVTLIPKPAKTIQKKKSKRSHEYR